MSKVIFHQQFQSSLGAVSEKIYWVLQPAIMLQYPANSESIVSMFRIFQIQVFFLITITISKFSKTPFRNRVMLIIEFS